MLIMMIHKMVSSFYIHNYSDHFLMMKLDDNFFFKNLNGQYYDDRKKCDTLF